MTTPQTKIFEEECTTSKDGAWNCRSKDYYSAGSPTLLPSRQIGNQRDEAREKESEEEEEDEIRIVGVWTDEVL